MGRIKKFDSRKFRGNQYTKRKAASVNENSRNETPNLRPITQSNVVSSATKNKLSLFEAEYEEAFFVNTNSGYVIRDISVLSGLVKKVILHFIPLYLHMSLNINYI